MGLSRQALKTVTFGAVLLAVPLGGASSALAGTVVATNSSEIPSEWKAIAPAGSCIADPFKPDCRDETGGPVRKAIYPDAATLKAQNDQPGFEPDAPLVGVGGADLPATTATVPFVGAPDASASTSATQGAASAAVSCQIAAYPVSLLLSTNPSVGHYVGFSGSVVCPPGYYIAATAQAQLLRDGGQIAFANADSVGIPSATARGTYNCHHSQVHTYKVRTVGFLTQINGLLVSDSVVGPAENHTCPT